MSYNPQFAKLGEILVNENMITEEQLNQALAEQKNKKGFYEYLSEKKNG